MPITQQDEVAGFGAVNTTLPNRCLDDITTVRGGAVIEGAETRDPTQTNPVYLGSGMPMGRVTATGKYAPAVMGLAEAYTSAETEITTTPASAAELLRRVGASGTFQIQGLVAGVLTKQQVTYSAIVVATGVITVTDLAATYAANAWIQPEDGSETVVTIYNGLNLGFPQRVTNEVSGLNVDLRFPAAIAALVIESKVTFWPVAGVFRDALRTELNTFGNFQFQEQYVG